MRVEAAEPQVGAHRHAGLERQHRQLRLPAQGTAEGAAEVAGCPLRLLQPVIRGDGVRISLQPLEPCGRERRLVKIQVARVGRQEIGRPCRALRCTRPVRLQIRPIRLADDSLLWTPYHGRRVGDGAQQPGLVDAGESGDASGLGEAAEAQVGNRLVGQGIVGGKQRAQGRIALGVAPAPVVHDAHGVCVRLRVHAVDDQHAPVVFREERRVVGEGGVGDVAGLADVVALRPVVDDRLARRVGLGVAEARRVPAAVGLHEDEQLAAVVGGVDQRQAEARRCGCGGQQALEQGASSHGVLSLEGSDAECRITLR